VWKFTDVSSIIRVVIALVMEAASTSETSVNVCQTTRHYYPEDSLLHTRRRENLKSYCEGKVFTLKILMTVAK
jgi:hypothetical protein